LVNYSKENKIETALEMLQQKSSENLRW